MLTQECLFWRLFCCFAIWEINTKITFLGRHKQFATPVHSLFYINQLNKTSTTNTTFETFVCTSIHPVIMACLTMQDTWLLLLIIKCNWTCTIKKILSRYSFYSKVKRYFLLQSCRNCMKYQVNGKNKDCKLFASHLLIIWSLWINRENISCVSGGRFKNTYELLNQRALKFSYVNKIHIFQCMGKIFCVEFQRYPLKFHSKYLTHTLKDVHFIHRWKFKSS